MLPRDRAPNWHKVFCDSNLFPGEMKAIIKWPSEYGWSKDAGAGNRDIWGDQDSVDMDDTNTRAQVAGARRRFLGGETGYCRKKGARRGVQKPGPVESAVRKVLQPSMGERR